MKVLYRFSSTKRYYPEKQDDPTFLGFYNYYIIEVNGVKYLADTTLFRQCLNGDNILAGTIQLNEDEVIVHEEAGCV